MSANKLVFDIVKMKTKAYKSLKGELLKNIKLHAGEAVVKNNL